MNNNFPQWAAEAVWYQIFPDRFCRLNQDNPITAQDILGTAPWNINAEKPWQIHPWTADWNLRQPYENGNTKDFHTNKLRRRFCGDINGVISKLDYLADLGVNALYFTPLQYSPSLHKYDGTNFLHVDPFFGSNPRADIGQIDDEDFDDFDNATWTTADRETLRLISEAHKRGMKVMFDGVFNHIGYNSKPFQDVLKNHKESKYADWFHIDWTKTTPKRLQYEKFWGCVKEMPKLNYGSQEVKRYVFATLKRWLNPIVEGVGYEGIDGWRLDHAIGVPMTFWKSAHEFCKKINKNSLFLAEFIEPDTIIKPYLENGAFDCVMNYGFYFLACEFFTGDGKKMTAKEFDRKIWNQLKLYPLGSNYLAMNLLGTHDTERIASLIVNRKMKEYGSIEKFFQNTHCTDRGYTSRRPDELERQIQRMMIVFEFAMIGAPMVYYGDELGMYGGNDPDCRKPMCWPDMKFDDEHEVRSAMHKYYVKEPIAADMELRDFYKRIIALRRSSKALTQGTMTTDYASSDSRVWVISRRSGSERIIFAFNCEKSAAKVRIVGLPGREYADCLGGCGVIADNKGAIDINLPPNSFRVLCCPNA